MNKIKAVNNPKNVCMKCLSNGSVRELIIHSLGYGSSFDNFSSKIQLCKNCYNETNKEWWEFKIVKSEYCEEYEHEDEILKYIKTFPLEGQELFYSRFSYGACAHNMEPQDWIDYKLKILPHEKCKEYHLYSHQEIDAYHDRFPNCGHVYKKVYGDNSAACYCPRNASGKEDGSCGGNIAQQCYRCTQYKPRTKTMETINDFEEFVKREVIRLKEMIIYAERNLKLLTENPKEYYNNKI